MKEELKSLGLDLFDQGIILTNGPFDFKFHEKHPNAPHSGIKVNLRFSPEGTLTNELTERIGNALYQVICEGQLQYDCIVGVPKAGNPLAKAVARLASVPLLSLEKEETEKRRMILPVIQGEYHQGWRVLIIDDVLVMAYSKFEAIEAVKGNGLAVVGIAVLIDWEHGGIDNLKAAGIPVLTGFKMTELLLLYLKEGKILPQEYQEAIDYLKAVKAYFGGFRRSNRV